MKPKVKNHFSEIARLHKSETLKKTRFSKANITIFSIIFAAIGGYLIYNSFAATGDTANIFVDVNGGTCTRNSSLTTYNDATACASLNAAYQAASLGDIVIVKAGTYPAQIILENASKASTSDLADIVFQPATSEVVVVRGIDSGTGDGSGGTNGADHMTFRGFKMDHDGNRCDFRLRPDTYDITIEGTDVCSVGMIQVNNIVVKNNTLGPCYGNELWGACTNNRMEGGSNISWINNTFTEYTRPFTNNPPEGWHWECMVSWTVDNLVIRGNRFERCATVTLALYAEPGGGSCSYTWSGVTVESNIFDRPTDIDNNYASQGQPAVQIKDGGNLSNWLFRQNSFAPGTGVLWDSGFNCAKTNFKEIGDVGNGLGCGNGVTHTYNMMGSPCNSGDDTNNSAFINPFINNALLGSGGDLHLAGAIGSTAADNKVPAASCAPIDVDGEARPADTNCDAGADERGVNSNPTPPPPPPPPPSSDPTPPTVSITAPASGATVSGASVTLSANATDNVGVSGVQFKVDGNNVGSEDTTSPYSITWNSTSVANGSHAITAVARDAAGNSTTSSAININTNNSVSDTTPPSVPQGLAVTAKTQTSISISWNASTDNVAVTGYRLFNGATVLGTTTNLTYTFTGLTCNTTYSNLGITAFDAAGNQSDVNQAIVLPTTTNACTTAKTGDINGDNQVNITDLSLLLSSYGQSTTQCITNTAFKCDLSSPGDGVVNIFDLSILLSKYGT